MAKIVGYVPDFPLPELIERGVDTSLTITVRGPVASIMTATAATLTVRDSRGTAIVDTETADVSVVGVTASFDLDGALTSSLTYSDRWTVEWVVTLEGVSGTLTFRNQAALCRTVPSCPVTEADVFGRVPALDPVRPGSISRESDWGGVIHDAWIQIQQCLLRQDRRPELLITSGSVREPTLLLVLAGIYDSLAASVNQDVGYSAIANGYRDRFAALWPTLSFPLDANEDGTTDGGRENTAGPKWLM